MQVNLDLTFNLAKVTWTWEAKHAGAFYYHCGADGLNGVWEHIANGMYGGVVVHPQNEQPR